MDDAELIRCVRAGDCERFRPLVDRYHGPIVRFVRNLVGAEDAEDVAQEVFLAAFKNLASFDEGRARFSTWLYAIARNRGLSVLRDRSAPREVVSDELSARPDGESDRAGLAADLDRAFDALPAEQRTAFLLSEVEGLAYSEIARIEDVRVGTIKSRVHRARARLRDLLEHVREDARK